MRCFEVSGAVEMEEVEELDGEEAEDTEDAEEAEEGIVGMLRDELEREDIHDGKLQALLLCPFPKEKPAGKREVGRERLRRCSRNAWARSSKEERDRLAERTFVVPCCGVLETEEGRESAGDEERLVRGQLAG
jgi:hypothetical protein